MHSLTQGFHLKETQVDNTDNSGKMAHSSTVKLNVNAQEFVPSFKRNHLKRDEPLVGFTDLMKTYEDEEKATANLMLPWKGFPKKPEKNARSTQVALINDVDYMILPSIKRSKKQTDDILLVDLINNPETKETNDHPSTFSHAEKRNYPEQKRRENERKVALEALKLSEQRRMRVPLISPTADNANSDNVQPIIHLSRSPVRFAMEEKWKVDRLRDAKKERIERILREMTNEKQEQLKQQQLQQQNKIRNDTVEPKSSISDQQKSEKNDQGTTKKRYIPTTKEWDEQCRAKYLAKLNADKQNKDEPQDSATSKPLPPKSNVVNISPSGVIRLGDLRATTKPLYCPPNDLLDTEKRKGNITHFRPLPNWTIRQTPQEPLKVLTNKMGKIVQRYSIEQLLAFEPQPGDLEKPYLDEALNNLGFLCD
ncbi:uncharacterized protein LOC108118412 [Drosophila eugracilis]|uniref:uncharacterized protein LOC108118412 n=1 Tax=Drosophila eugracilis TaxID=29029 RepID=UPI001BDA7A26|nr:uncharacterized protein LOC108118412 [Drosophila eugracilis]